MAPTAREWGLLAVFGVGWFLVYNLALNAAEHELDPGTAAMLVNNLRGVVDARPGLVTQLDVAPPRLREALLVAFLDRLTRSVRARRIETGVTDRSRTASAERLRPLIAPPRSCWRAPGAPAGRP